MEKLNECIIVAGKKEGNYFLAKNRDRAFIADYKIIHEMYEGTEVVYYEDSTGWMEGMNEHSVGYIYSKVMFKDARYYKYRSKWGIKAGKTSDREDGKPTKKSLEKKEDYKKIMTFKTAEAAIEYLKDIPWNGNYYVGDKDGVYELEHFERQTKINKLDFTKFKNFKVKTNFGELIPYSGHQDGPDNVARGSSEVRKIEAERYLLGFKNYTDVLKRLQTQVFTNDQSSLNVFRTDGEEITVSQVLMDLNNRIFQFVHYDETSNFFGIEDRLPKGYKPRLKIFIRDKKEFSKGGEMDKFMYHKDDLHSHVSKFNIDF